MSGFLQKIMGKGTEPGRGGSQPDDSFEAIVESIQSHLVLLLNTRQGMTLHLPDYGLPDIHTVYHELPKSLDELGEQIRKTLEIYEPRLTQVRVSLKKKPMDTFQATFLIKGLIRRGSGSSRIVFQTDVLNDGTAETKVVDRFV